MHNWVNPALEEEATLDQHVHTLQFFHGFGESEPRDAPAPPNCVEGNGIKTGRGNETSISPAKARELTRWMRIRAAVIRQHERRQELKRCKRGHLMTSQNTYAGRNGRGAQCRECRNDSQRRRYAA